MDCPDCGAVPVDNHMAHDPTCPLGMAADATSEADREFFESHPEAEFYWRDPAPSEVADLRLAGACPDVPGEMAGRVKVTNLGPGLRSRDFSRLHYIPAKETRS